MKDEGNMSQSAKQKTSGPGDLLRHVQRTDGERKALAGLARGRVNAIRNAKIVGAPNAEQVLTEAMKDLEAGGGKHKGSDNDPARAS